MSEYPSPRPTEDVTFATDGGAPKTEPSSGLRAAGWQYKAVVAHEVLNWIVNALGASLAWLRAAALRAWSQPYEAWAAHAWGEPFMLRLDPSGLVGGVTDAKALAGSGGTNDSQLCSDGARVFYNRGAFVYAARNDHTTDAAELASAAHNNGGNALCAHTDGRLVAWSRSVVSGGSNLQAYLIDDAGGLTLWMDSGAEDEDCYACLCDWGAGGASDGVVWWGDDAPALRVYSAGEGTADVTGTISQAIRALDTLGPLLFVATSDGALKSYFKANSVPAVADPITDMPHRTYVSLGYAPRTVSLCNDGEVIYMLVDGTGTGTTDIESIQLHAFRVWSGELLWSKYTNTSNTVGRRLRLSCDDRFIYATWNAGVGVGIAVMDKADGGVVKMVQPSGNVVHACDGVASFYYLNSSANTLHRVGVGRGPGLFVRQAPMQGRSTHRVIAPLTRHP